MNIYESSRVFQDLILFSCFYEVFFKYNDL